MSRGGDSATHGSLAATSKNAAPVSRTVFNRSDSASAAIRSPADVRTWNRTLCQRPPEFRTRCQAIRMPGHSYSPPQGVRKGQGHQGRKSTMHVQTAAHATIDLAAIKGRQRVAWGSGDYAIVGTTLQIVGERLCEAIDLRSSQRVLDVAAGNGNATLAAARRFADVVSTDYVGALLDRGRERAEAERLPVTFQEADAENLPFADASFDVVLSTFGVMFTPNQERAAAELVRVCRPNGRIGLTNWTPEGFVGQMFKIVGRYAPPPAGIQSPVRWGTEAGLDELFGATVRRIEVQRRQFVFRYRTP